MPAGGKRPGAGRPKGSRALTLLAPTGERMAFYEAARQYDKKALGVHEAKISSSCRSCSAVCLWTTRMFTVQRFLFFNPRSNRSMEVSIAVSKLASFAEKVRRFPCLPIHWRQQRIVIRRPPSAIARINNAFAAPRPITNARCLVHWLRLAAGGAELLRGAALAFSR